ncbi:hypothetical protein FTUN_1402 [Frigoriglobus tundricola]|uniref:Uncharacterized protein n=1 Tax=Frigoriglobus tundricola TaxID=2774151 RepID=A0A6M5YIT1_9BACT|nr:hypothetical protein FTUN_1402 [Frigoriglobus tundricola]
MSGNCRARRRRADRLEHFHTRTRVTVRASFPQLASNGHP